MSEPTNTELADWADLHSEGRGYFPRSHPWYALIASRLREMDGERVEGTAFQEDPECSGDRSFAFVEGDVHAEDERTAVLYIAQPPEENDGNV